MSTTLQILAGLAASLLLGLIGAATEHPSFLSLNAFVEPIGTLWLNALRMTIVPLVVSLLVTSIALASEAAGAGRTTARAIAWIAAMLGAAALFAALMTPLVLALFPLDPGAAAALAAAGSPDVQPQVLPLAQWFTEIIPANPIRAAADGAMLPIVVFALLLGFATARLENPSRDRLVGFFRALADALMTIVHWVLRLAPIGVFALVYPVALSAGANVVGAIGHYVVVLVALCLLVTAVLYPVTWLAGSVPIARFAAAVAPAQAVAFSTRSSLASLPAMLEGTQSQLRIPTAVTGLVLPLAVSLMRITSPVVNLGAAIWVAALLAVDLSAIEIMTGAIVAALTSLGAVGLPGHVSFMATRLPIFLAMGVPIEILGLLLAVDVIPDTFQTVGNVTADVSVTTIVARAYSE